MEEWDACAQFQQNKDSRNKQNKDNVHEGSPNYSPRRHFIQPHRHFVNNEKTIYIYETCVDLVDCNLFRNNHIALDVRPSNSCAVAYVAQLAKKFGDPCCRLMDCETLFIL